MVTFGVPEFSKILLSAGWIFYYDLNVAGVAHFTLPPLINYHYTRMPFLFEAINTYGRGSQMFPGMFRVEGFQMYWSRFIIFLQLNMNKVEETQVIFL